MITCITDPVCLLQQDDPGEVPILEQLGHVDPRRPSAHYAYPVLAGEERNIRVEK